MMKKFISVPFCSAFFTIIVLSPIYISPVLAEEKFNITDVKDCQGISGDAERLTCYDTVSRGGIFNEQQLKQVQVEQFGSKNMRKPPEPEPAATSESAGTVATDAGKVQESPSTPSTKISIDEIHVTVVRVKKDSKGIFYFQTSDNQVWKQQNATSWSLTVPFEAKIEKGMMGSFFLVNEGGKSTRVKRVK